MKNRMFPILAVMFIVVTSAVSSIAQTPLSEDLEDILDSLRDSLRKEADLSDSNKTFKIGKSYINDIKYSPDGSRLAVAGHSGVLLYDIHRQANAKKDQKKDKPVKLAGHIGRCLRIAFCPDGKIIATLNGLGDLCLYDANSGKHLRTIEGASIVAFSPDGRMIATGGDTDHRRNLFNFHLYDVDTGKLIRTFIGHTHIIRSVAFSLDGRMIATGGGSRDSTVRLWETQTGRHFRTLTGYQYGINTVVFSPDGTLLATGGMDEPSCLWDVKTGQQIRVLGNGDAEGFTDSPMDTASCVAFSPVGRMIASSNLLGIHLWDVNTGRLLRKFRERSIGHGISLVVFSPDGRTIAACGSNEVDLWDAETGQFLRMLKIPDYFRNEQNKGSTNR